MIFQKTNFQKWLAGEQSRLKLTKAGLARSLSSVASRATVYRWLQNRPVNVRTKTKQQVKKILRRMKPAIEKPTFENFAAQIRQMAQSRSRIGRYHKAIKAAVLFVDALKAVPETGLIAMANALFDESHRCDDVVTITIMRDGASTGAAYLRLIWSGGSKLQLYRRPTLAAPDAGPLLGEFPATAAGAINAAEAAARCI